ncbi:MAG: protease, partial [Proteobacteria bacterium]
MTHLKLDGVKVAILAANGFEQDELFKPKLKLVECGATTTLLSIKNGEIRGAIGDETGDICAVDAEVFGA